MNNFKEWLKISCLGLLLLAPGMVQANDANDASDAGDRFFVGCLLEHTELAPANQRFYCACETANFQTALSNKQASLQKISTKSTCSATINPYYELLHKQKLAAQKQDIDWSWI